MAAALGAQRFRGGEGAEAMEWGGGSIYCAVEEADGPGHVAQSPTVAGMGSLLGSWCDRTGARVPGA
jgi:hypothetical protein